MKAKRPKPRPALKPTAPHKCPEVSGVERWCDCGRPQCHECKGLPNPGRPAMLAARNALGKMLGATKCSPKLGPGVKLASHTGPDIKAPPGPVRAWIHSEDLRRQPLIGTLVGDQHRRIEGLVPVFIVRESDVQRITDRISRNQNSQVHRALRELGLSEGGA